MGDNPGKRIVNHCSSEEIERALSSRRLQSFQRNLLILTGLVWTAESMEMLLISFISSDLRFEFNISSPSVALLTTSVGIGMMGGNLTLGYFSDAYGRKPIILVSTVFTGLFGILSAVSPNYWIFLFSRLCVGFGIGGCIVAVNILTEMTPVNKRGEYNLILGAYWSFGAIFEALFATIILPSFSWRVLVLLTAAPSILVFAYVYFDGMPESVPWLISKGKYIEAQEVLYSLNALDHMEGEEEETEHDKILKDHSNEFQDESMSVQSESMWMDGAKYIAVLICLLYFLSAFLYYGLVLLQRETLSMANSLGTLTSRSQKIIAVDSGCIAQQLTRSDFLSTLYASVGELPGILVMILTLSMIGRRPLISYSMLFLTFTFIVLIFYKSNYIFQTVLFFAARGLSIGFFQAVIIYCSEMYPSSIKSSSVGIASAFSRLGLLITPFIAQVLIHTSMDLTLLIYAIASLVGAIGITFIPVETTGRSSPGSMNDFLELLQIGDGTDEFKNDHTVPRLARLFRWTAKVDGKIKPV